MNNNRIAITTRVVNAQGYSEKRDALSQDWIYFLEKINSMPIMMPNVLADVKKFLTVLQINGVILSGGDNKGDNLERDQTEDKIIRYAVEQKIPIFGVCRGMQVLNGFFGGTIQVNPDSGHVGSAHDIVICHPSFSEALGSKLKVNSFHNNIIKKENLADDLKPFAINESDNTIEGFFHKTLPIIGVMWHPEREQNMHNETLLKKSLAKEISW